MVDCEKVLYQAVMHSGSHPDRTFPKCKSSHQKPPGPPLGAPHADDGSVTSCTNNPLQCISIPEASRSVYISQSGYLKSKASNTTKMPHHSRFDILISGLFAAGRRSMFGVPGRLDESASVPRNGDRAGATTDSRSKYPDSPFFSGSAILIGGGFGRLASSGLWLYR